MSPPFSHTPAPVARELTIFPGHIALQLRLLRLAPAAGRAPAPLASGHRGAADARLLSRRATSGGPGSGVLRALAWARPAGTRPSHGGFDRHLAAHLRRGEYV